MWGGRYQRLKKQRNMLSQERLRQIAWEVGHRYPIPLAGDYIALSMINPRLGYVHWNIRKESAETLLPNEAFKNATLVVRVYDVTDIIFDGFNAHMFFDLQVNGLTGNYYFRIDHLARNYLAEAGLRSRDGVFHSLARSNPTFFDRDRPSGNYQIAGLFAGGALNRVFPVENIFDAPVYEKMNRELAGIERQGELSVAVVFLGIDGAAGFNKPLGSFIRSFSQMFKKFGGKVQFFSPLLKEAGKVADKSFIKKINAFSDGFYKQLSAIHKKTPFHLIHCHDWYSSAVGSAAAREMNLPIILSLHSTEYERTQGNKMDSFSSAICERERIGVQEAALVIVPHSSTRQQVINLYDASPEKVVIIPDVLTESPPGIPSDAAEIKQLLGLNPDAPMVLFAGEISHAAGADLMVDALPTACRNHRTAQFVFAGDGPLKGELEARAWHNGIGHRCRFLGDVSRETFTTLLNASDFVVIPVRTWQDKGLSQMAIGCDRPVLTTRQAGINCVVHGENGLVTFDNPGSIVWGIQELLFNPLQGSMLRLVAKKNAGKTPSLENIAVQHYTYYEMVLKNIQGVKNA
jgi:glycosyltransferase involved in cell wall biosynthesis